MKTFGERCPQVTVTIKQEKADYIVLLDHEGGAGLARRDNKVVVFNKNGGTDDMIQMRTPPRGGPCDTHPSLGVGAARLGGLVRRAYGSLAAKVSVRRFCEMLTTHKGRVTILFLPAVLFTSFAAEAVEKPKVRAITAFVRLSPAHYQEQIREALKVLRDAKAAFEGAGYEVQGLRISSQPFPDFIRGLSQQEAVALLWDYDRLVREEKFLASIGPVMLKTGDELEAIEVLKEVFPRSFFYSSILVADETGVDWEAVRQAAKLIRFFAEHSPDSEANAAFAAIALVPPNTPFYPGSYTMGPGHEFAVALESANVVDEVFATTAGDPQAARTKLVAALGEHAVRVERIAKQVGAATGWSYVGLDVSPAPDRQVSIGAAVEKFTGAKFGSSGTIMAAVLITDVLHSLPVKRIGYSGLMVPVLEDNVLAQRWSEGAIALDALLAYSAVCGTGLDTIPLPGDVSEAQLERIIGDMASLAVKLQKPLSARLMPIVGKKAGDRTEFSNPDLGLVNAVIQPLR